MKLGIFDSGLGGISIAKAIDEKFPRMDKLYLGDTLNLPYGSRSQEAIYQACVRCMRAMFEQDCRLVIMACNTASARTLRRLQQEFLPTYYPDRRILGVVVPTIEEAIERGYRKLAVIGTDYTISTGIYTHELTKINKDVEIVETPLLVPLIEGGGEKYLDLVLDDYLAFTDGAAFDALLLGCTHYIHLKERIRALYDFDVIAQDEIIPEKLALYLKRHPDIAGDITVKGDFDFYVTDLTERYAHNAAMLFGRDINVQLMEDVHECT